MKIKKRGKKKKRKKEKEVYAYTVESFSRVSELLMPRIFPSLVRGRNRQTVLYLRFHVSRVSMSEEKERTNERSGKRSGVFDVGLNAERA